MAIATFSAPLLGLILIASMGALLYGADRLVLGASALARLMKIPTIIIGLTVVAFGTSLPEMVVSVFAALGGNTDIALGNVIGSNIANIGLILGISAVIAPVLVESRTLKREVPFVLGVSFLFWLVTLTGMISRLSAVLFLILFVGFVLLSLRNEIVPVPDEVKDEPPFGAGAALGWTVLGLLLLLAGGNYLVESASELALRVGVSEAFVGLSVVAVGTSLPELATCVAAGLRKENDLILGNVIGSNVFNLLLVLGVCGVIHPVPVVPPYPIREVPLMLLFTGALYGMLWSGRRLARIEGGLLLIGYAVTVLLLYLYP